MDFFQAHFEIFSWDDQFFIRIFFLWYVTTWMYWCYLGLLLIRWAHLGATLVFSLPETTLNFLQDQCPGTSKFYVSHLILKKPKAWYASSTHSNYKYTNIHITTWVGSFIQGYKPCISSILSHIQLTRIMQKQVEAE